MCYSYPSPRKSAGKTDGQSLVGRLASLQRFAVRCRENIDDYKKWRLRLEEEVKSAPTLFLLPLFLLDASVTFLWYYYLRGDVSNSSVVGSVNLYAAALVIPGFSVLFQILILQFKFHGIFSAVEEFDDLKELSSNLLSMVRGLERDCWNLLGEAEDFAVEIEALEVESLVRDVQYLVVNHSGPNRWYLYIGYMVHAMLIGYCVLGGWAVYSFVCGGGGGVVGGIIHGFGGRFKGMETSVMWVILVLSAVCMLFPRSSYRWFQDTLSSRWF